MKYVYPAILEPNELGGYCVNFPDVQGGYTEGKNLSEAIEAAQDVLSLILYNREMRGENMPVASLSEQIHSEKDSIVTLISCDTDYYKRYFANKNVEKRLSIPAWLNAEAERANLNFSQILQQGLKSYLNIERKGEKIKNK